MARSDVTIIEALESVALYLRTALALNEATCFWSLTNDAPLGTPATLWLTITPDGGTFDAALFDGGGREQLTTNSGIAVNINSVVQLDQAGHANRLLMDASRGMFAMLHKVLDAITGADPEHEGNPFLRELMQPEGFGRPEQNRANPKVYSMAVVFKLPFDWKLAAAPAEEP